MACCVLTPKKAGLDSSHLSKLSDIHNQIFLWYCFKDYFKNVLCVRVLPVLMHYSGVGCSSNSGELSW